MPRSSSRSGLPAQQPGEEGARLLVELADGQTVESVLLPRDGVCISSQIGCAVGCSFCMTGKQGLLRQVSSAEMIAQVVIARARRPVRRVVFMGWADEAIQRHRSPLAHFRRFENARNR